MLVVGLPDGSACALKIEDGGARPLFVAMHRILEIAGLEAEILRDRPQVLGGGKQVGEVQTRLLTCASAGCDPCRTLSACIANFCKRI